MVTGNSNNNGGDLVLGAMRPQHDLFTGTSVLGIPDVNTHVGSVIHAFETMAVQRDARQRSAADKSSSSSGQRRRSESGHRISLPASPPTATHLYSQTDTLTGPNRATLAAHHQEYFIEKPMYEAAASNYRVPRDRSGDRAALLQHQQSSINSNQTRIPVINKKRDSLDAKTITIESRTMAGGGMGDEKRRHNNANLPIIGGGSSSTSSAAIEETSQNVETDFIRGSTVSQSFVKNVKNSRAANRSTSYEKSVTKITKHAAPQPPTVGASSDKVTGSAATTGTDVPKRGGNASSVSKLERRIRARSSGGAANGEEKAQQRSRSNSRNRSNERRKSYNPSSLDRAEL